MRNRKFYKALSFVLAGALLLSSANMTVYAETIVEETETGDVQEKVAESEEVKEQETVSEPEEVNEQEMVSEPEDVQGQENTPESEAEQEQETMPESKVEELSDEQAVNSFIIVLDANGGGVGVESITVTDGGTYGELPIPEREGYRFDGWFTGRDDGEKITEDTEVALEGDSTLYAHWTRVYKLILKLEDGLFEKMDSTVYEIESGKTVKEALADLYAELEIEDIEEPVRTGYIFRGWYDDREAGNLYDFDSVLTEDTYVYAQWDATRQVAAPVANIETGTLVKADTVIKLSTETLDAKIYYTTDKTEPTLADNTGRELYTDGIVAGKLLNEENGNTILLKAYAVKTGSADSEVVTFEYTVVDEKTNWGEIVLEDRALFATELMPDGDPEKVPEGMWIGGIKETGYMYSGSSITFLPDTVNEIRVYDGKKLLQMGHDYKLSYKNNKNAYELQEGEEGYHASKAPSVTVTGIGNYVGSITRTFVINRADLAAQNEFGDAMFKAQDITVPYNGNLQKGTTQVVYTNADGKSITLNAKTDYEYSYPHTDSSAEDYDESAFVEARENPYEIVITGKGNYKGELICNQKITANILLSKVKVADIPAQNYNQGEEIKPELTLTYDGKVLTLYDEVTGKGDYAVNYENNIYPGMAKVTITGKGDFEGTRTVTFKINGIELKKARLTGFSSSYEYTGDEIKQNTARFTYVSGTGENAVTIELVEGTHYTATYTKHVDVGTATVVYSGINGWTGSIKKTYKITAYDLAKDVGNRVTVTDEEGNAYPVSIPYAKGGVKPTPMVKYTSPEGVEYTLKSGKDYVLKYSNNKALNDGTNTKKLPTVKITGKGNFKGTRQKDTFTIVGADISGLNLAVADKVYVNKKNNFTTSLVITDVDGKKLVVGKDYEKTFQYYYCEDIDLADGTMRKKGTQVSSNDIVPAGTILKVVVTGKGLYAGSGEEASTISGIYRIVSADLSKASVKVNTQYYTGKEVCPDKSQIVITLKGKVLTAQDYEIVSYANNKNKGTAKITIRGVGDYGGVKTANFKIATKPMYCMLTFNANGATSGKMKDMKLTFGKDYTLSNNGYKRANYVFKGWNTEPDGTGKDADGNVVFYENKAVNPILIGEEDAGKTIVLYAQWEPEEYKITYHLNGGKNHVLNTRTSYKVSDENFVIHSPEREDWPKGYQFGGWYKENTYKNKIRTVKTGSFGDLNLYAKWVPYSYTVAFDSNVPEEEWDAKKVSGSMAEEAFSYGVPKALNANKFKRSGYVFAGWSMDANAAMPDYIDKQIISSDLLEKRNNINGKVTLYAVWRNVFQVNYETYGGEILGEAISSYEYGNTVYNLPQNVKKEGYVFEGWYQDASLKRKVKSIAKKSTGDKLLFAKWKPLSYKITFDGNGHDTGSMKTLAAKYDMPVTLKENGFVKKGYKHIGWALSANGEVVYTDASNAVNILPAKNNEIITLYAIWEETDYKVTYYTNGGELADKEEETFQKIYSESYRYDAENSYELPTPVRDRYEFAGWYQDKNFKTKADAIKKGSYGDIAFYAKWTIKNEVTDFFITYEENGGIIDVEHDSNYRTDYVYSETQSYALPVPTREGYEFAGWYKDAGFKTKLTQIPKKSREDFTLYAKWTGKKYQIDFLVNAPEGTKSTGKTKINKLVYGTETALNKNGFKIPGYSFVGWSTTPLGEVEFIDGQKVSGNESLLWNGFVAQRTLYAIWEKDIYGIVYNNMAGIVNPNPDSYTVDDTVILEEPEMMGNTFLGWYLDAKCKKKVTTIKQGSTGTKTLYAKWAHNHYTLCYNLNCKDDSVVMDTSKVGYITSQKSDTENGYLLPTATRNGYTFGGWYKEAACKKAVGPIIASPYVDMTVYAKWIPITYAIRFDKNDENATGTMKDMQKLQFGKDYKLAKNTYKKTGYAFVGWNTEADGSGISYGNQQIINSLTYEQDSVIRLYAKWEIENYSITYHLNGGINHEENPTTYTVEDEEIELKEPTRDDYEFLGWYEDSKFTASKKVTSIKKGSTGNKVLYAKWKLCVIMDVEVPDTYIDVSDYGATKDDNTDDTEAFEEAIAKASKNASSGGINTVYVPAGVYMIKPGDANNDPEPGIALKSNVNLVMDNDAILQVMSTSLSEYCVMSAKYVQNINVTGGQIKGERYKHSGSYGEWGHGIGLYGASNVTFSNMVIASNWGDGIYLGTQAVRQPDNTQKYVGCENINISHCEIYDNRRSNISLTDADEVNIEYCFIYDAHGTAPQCGVYIEPNSNSSGDKVCRGITIQNTVITPYKNKVDSEYMCFMTHYNPYNSSYVTADDIWFIDCVFNGFVGNYSGTNLHRQNTVITGPFVNMK